MVSGMPVVHTQALSPPRVVPAGVVVLCTVQLDLRFAWNSTTPTICSDVPEAVWPCCAASVAYMLTVLELCPLFSSHRNPNC